MVWNVSGTIGGYHKFFHEMIFSYSQIVKFRIQIMTLVDIRCHVNGMKFVSIWKCSNNQIGNVKQTETTVADLMII